MKMVSNHSSNWKHLNVQIASLVCGVALATIAIAGVSEVIRDSGESTPLSPVRVAQPTGPVIDPTDFGSLGIAYQLAQQQALAASAAALQDARGIGQPAEGTKSVEATLIDPTDFGSLGIEWALAQPSHPPEAAMDYSLPTTFGADFFGTGQPDEGAETREATGPLFGTMVDGVYVIESDIRLP